MMKETRYLQPFERGLNVRKFEKDSVVWDVLVIKHEANAPHNGRETDVLGAGQVVQNNLGLDLVGHVWYAAVDQDLTQEWRCICKIYKSLLSKPRRVLKRHVTVV
jgi:hypothetical protein